MLAHQGYFMELAADFKEHNLAAAKILHALSRDPVM